jgi:hypothetical protein
MDRFLIPGQFPVPGNFLVSVHSFWKAFFLARSQLLSSFRFPSGKFWFAVSASSKVSCPGQLIGSLSCMPSFLIPCPGQFIRSLPCLVLRLHVLFKTPFPSTGQFPVFLSCSVLRFSALVHFQFPIARAVPCFPDQFSSPFPRPGQFFVSCAG